MAKILVVDDESDIRTYLQMLFEDNGHEVKTAENGTEGTRLLHEFKPELIILDIIMPIQSGINLYKTIRTSEEFNNIPVIFLSAVVRHRHQFTEKFADLPQPQAYVDKPFEPERIIALVESLLR